MRTLVTGGAGYIGAITAQALADAGHEVVVIDNLSAGHRQLVPADARLVVGDADDPAVLADALSGGIDACLHFAALIEAGESMRRPEAFFAVNTAGTLQLLRQLIEHGVDRFVLSSTAAVYGEPTQVPIREDDPTMPTNAYGASKLLVEEALVWLHQLRGLRYASLRYFNAAGASQHRGEDHDPETHLIPRVLRVAADPAEQIGIFGTDYPTPDGSAVRDYIHVADLADAHVLAVEALERHGRIVCNLGNGSGFSVREVIAAVERVTGRQVNVREEERRSGDPAVLVASAERAGELLGWTPRRGLEDIIASAWDWHQQRSAAAARSGHGPGKQAP